MSDVLIRDVPGDDLDLIRSTAARTGVSLQSYLRSTVQAQATYLRRQQTLAALDERLHDRPPVGEEDRRAVLDTLTDDHEGRAEELAVRDDGDRPS
ncbi:hypothetical protein WDZ17_04260 [Pseudokineococcus basanitobsidens]|uniref:Antitoxin n=1 Tax=Pseudokineococcus basanitobsidens TaxID=1926649 RepID=A0ABU8RHN4_9ACTN